MTPFDLAMIALEDAHQRYIENCRLHIAHLLSFGSLTPADVEPNLHAIDHAEQSQNQQREMLHSLHQDES